MSTAKDIFSVSGELFELISEFESVYKSGSISDLSRFKETYSRILDDARSFGIATAKLEVDASRLMAKVIDLSQDDYAKVDFVLTRFPEFNGQISRARVDLGSRNVLRYLDGWLCNALDNRNYGRAISYGFSVARATSNPELMISMIGRLEKRVNFSVGVDAWYVLPLSDAFETLAALSSGENSWTHPVDSADAAISRLIELLARDKQIALSAQKNTGTHLVDDGDASMDKLMKLLTHERFDIEVEVGILMKILDGPYRRIGERIFHAFPISCPQAKDLIALHDDRGLSYTDERMLDCLEAYQNSSAYNDLAAAFTRSKLHRNHTTGYAEILRNVELSDGLVSVAFGLYESHLGPRPTQEALNAAAVAVVERAGESGTLGRNGVMDALQRLPSWSEVERHLRSSRRTSRFILCEDFGL